MRTKFRLLLLVVAVATLSLQCTNDNAESVSLPTSIEQYFGEGKFTLEGVSLPYRTTTVSSGSSTKAQGLPLVVVLHGQYAGGRDNVSPLREDAVIRIWHHFYSNKIGAVLLVPQCPTSRHWDELAQDVNGRTIPEVLKALIDDFAAKKSGVDTSRIYILGYSDSSKPSGGGGVWRMLSNYPDTFAAGMSVAADPDSDVVVANIAKTPILSVKSESDIHIESISLESFAELVRTAGGIVEERFLEVGTRADLCRAAFTEPQISWVLQYTL